MDDKLKKVHSLLEDEYSFPCEYGFKFIVPVTSQEKLLKVLGEGYQITKKPSKKGNYISFSAKKVFNNANEIIEVYQSVEVVPGVMAL